jgi:hypothetical protein
MIEEISMRSRFGIKALFPVAAALLLSTALTAWGVSIILTGEAGGTISCTTNTVTVTDGNVTAVVPTDCIPTAGGGGTGPFTLSVARTGNTDSLNTVTGNTISCPGTCSASLVSTTPVSLTAIAGGTGANFIGWSGGACTGTGTCDFPINAPTTVTAIFGPLNLTVTTAGTGTGTVTSSPAGISCTTGSATGCSNAYSAVTPVTLTATDGTGTFAGWSGGCTGTATTCTVTMNASKSVTATFNVAGACGALPANTVVVDTGNINVAWPQPPVYLVPPQQITAFKVTVPSGFTGRNNFMVAKSSSGLKSKLVVVSTCPGVLTPVGAACTLAGVDTTTVRLSGNASDPPYYCKLTPGVYYANAVSKNAVTDTGFNCTTTSNCSFLASRSAPY